jgi:hypothetical protein
MALDGVPWFIGGQAQHGGDVARQLAYLACGGSEGVTASGDLKVVPLDQVGPGVKVLAGSASILNRVKSQQAYTVRNAEADSASVQIAGTGSTGGRSDLVVCFVDNPNIDSNAQQPADLAKGPYDRFDVVPGVPAGTRRLQDLAQYKGTTGYAIARVDQPANSSGVTAAMIVDLRSIARPRSRRRVQQAQVSAAFSIAATAATPAPDDGKVSALSVDVPDWATAANVRMTVVGVTNTSTNVAGTFSARIGTDVATAGTYYQEQTAGSSRLTYIVEDTVAIPAAYRGTTQRLRAYATRASASATGGLQLGTTSQIFWDVEFIEAAA